MLPQEKMVLLQYLADVEALLHQAASPDRSALSEHDFFDAKEKIAKAASFLAALN